MHSDSPILIVGAGQAGATAAAALRSFGHAGRILLIGEEKPPPYERPPLSKAVLADATMDERIGIHPTSFHAEHAIELRLGTRVQSIDAQLSQAQLSDGQILTFSRCLLATGGKARTLPDLPPRTPHVHYLRTLADAQALRHAMQRQQSMVVVGAGFLGLEIASTARGMGLDVTVLEADARVLPRAVPTQFSSWLQQRVRAAGVDLRLDCRCVSIRPQDDGVVFMLEDGSALHAPMVVVAIGLTPDVDLAQTAGLELHPHNGGVRVDAQCRTSAPQIYAAGDCASQYQPLLGQEVRLESWQSANEQARIAAAAMLSVSTDAAGTPWFWTDQFGCNVQMLGVQTPGLAYSLRGNPGADTATPKFLLLGFDDRQRVRHAIAVNTAGDLRQLRPLLQQGVPCDPARLLDPALPLRQIVRDALAAMATGV